MSNNTTQKRKRHARLKPLLDELVGVITGKADALPSWHWRRTLLELLGFRLRRLVGSTKQRQQECSRAKAIVWVAANRPEHSHRITREFLQNTLAVLIGDPVEGEIEALDLDADRFFAEAEEWAARRIAASVKFERDAEASEKRQAAARDESESKQTT